jgi:hypothetical protein
MRRFILGSLGVNVEGVQVVSLTNGSVVVKFVIVMDPSGSYVSSTQNKQLNITEITTQLKEKIVNDAFSVNAYLTNYNVDRTKSPKSKQANGCSLQVSPCGSDFYCVPKDKMETLCLCKKNNDGQCVKDTLNSWKIAVIVVAVFVFLLMVIIIIAIVRMYRRRHYTGKAYVSEHGRDNQGVNIS